MNQHSHLYKAHISIGKSRFTWSPTSTCKDFFNLFLHFPYFAKRFIPSLDIIGVKFVDHFLAPLGRKIAIFWFLGGISREFLVQMCLWCLYWPNNINYSLIVIQYRQVPTITVLYWPSTQLHHLISRNAQLSQLDLVSCVLFWSFSLVGGEGGCDQVCLFSLPQRGLSHSISSSSSLSSAAASSVWPSSSWIITFINKKRLYPP